MHRTGKLGHRALAASLVFALASAVVTLQAQEESVLFLKVFDVTNGQAVTDLEPSEITILEDDQPRQTVDVEVVDWPIKLTILVDNSRPVAPSLNRIRDGLRELIALQPEGVQIAILSTAPQPRFLVRMTADRAEALEALDRLAPDPGGAAFVDALVEASDRIREDDEPHFPVVLMLAADGGDPSGGMDRKLNRLQDQTLEQSVVNHFVIWTTGGFGSNTSGVQTGVANTLSQITGGRFEALSAVERMSTLLPEIGTQIAASYENQRNQLRVTYERPRGAEPPQQGFSSTVSRSGVGAILTLKGTMP